jgi:mannose-6-phosphate isomerase-like protein (cupin superfamily)
MLERPSGKIDKGWGYEIIWATNDLYCGKILVFEKAGAKTSMHYHKEKDKSWFVNAGQFQLIYIDTATTELKQVMLKEGDTWHILPLQPLQLIALQPDSMLIEVSTPDSISDTYRISPGDSQKSILAATPPKPPSV